jgi:hypothetical protein
VPSRSPKKKGFSSCKRLIKAGAKALVYARYTACLKHALIQTAWLSEQAYLGRYAPWRFNSACIFFTSTALTEVPP